MTALTVMVIGMKRYLQSRYVLVASPYCSNSSFQSVAVYTPIETVHSEDFDLNATEMAKFCQ